VQNVVHVVGSVQVALLLGTGGVVEDDVGSLLGGDVASGDELTGGVVVETLVGGELTGVEELDTLVGGVVEPPLGTEAGEVLAGAELTGDELVELVVWVTGGEAVGGMVAGGGRFVSAPAGAWATSSWPRRTPVAAPLQVTMKTTFSGPTGVVAALVSVTNWPSVVMSGAL
jgi:hypothetical protein